MKRRGKFDRLLVSLKAAAGSLPDAPVVSDFAYQAARARREHAQATMKEQDVIDMAATLLSRAEVLSALAEAEQVLRQCMAAGLAELAARIAPCSDELELAGILQVYVHDKLTEISERFEKMANEAN